MVNWKEIDQDFTPELQKDWENKGFNYEETSDWIKVGFSVSDAGYAEWLTVTKKKNASWLSSKSEDEKEELKEEYKKFLEEVNNGSKISVEVIKKIREFKHSYNFDYSHEWGNKLNQEQDSLVDKLISNEKLRQRYKKFGLCKSCLQPNTNQSRMSEGWCQACNAKRFQNEFNNWTSDNPEIDKFIQEFQLQATNHNRVLEWIPYDKLEIEKDEHGNNKILGKGHFGEVYKGKWVDGQIWNWNNIDSKWERYFSTTGRYQEIALKNLNSQDISIDFLREITGHKLITDDALSVNIVSCHGISKDPITGKYLMVMDYVEGGNLRQYLQNNQLSFKDKFRQFRNIVGGLNEIHQHGLIHKDLHPGNIVIDYVCYITDLGLCIPVDKKDQGKLYGVLTYVAPEVLRRDTHTKASDVYSLGIIAYELFSGFPPYYDSTDSKLRTKICEENLRPSLDDFIAPQLLKNLIKRCWNADPNVRPTTDELEKTLNKWSDEIDRKDTEFYHQYKETLEMEKLNQTNNVGVLKVFPQIIHAGQLINFLDLVQPQNNPSQEWQTYNLLDLQIKGIKKELEIIKESLSNELAKLVDEFVEIKKESIKNKEDKQVKKQTREVKKQLEEKSLSEEKINEVIRYCEKLVELEQKLEQEKLQTQIEITANN